MSHQPSVDSLCKCIVNSFSNDDVYLRNCCTGREPYINEYIQKRCNELHILQTPRDDNMLPIHAAGSSEVAVYDK